MTIVGLHFPTLCDMATVICFFSHMGRLRLTEVRVSGWVAVSEHEPTLIGLWFLWSASCESPTLILSFSPQLPSLHPVGPTQEQAACSTPWLAHCLLTCCSPLPGGPDALGHFCSAQDHVGVCHGDIKGCRGRKEQDQPVDCAPGWEKGPGARILLSTAL